MKKLSVALLLFAVNSMTSASGAVWNNSTQRLNNSQSNNTECYSGSVSDSAADVCGKMCSDKMFICTLSPDQKHYDCECASSS